MIEEALNSTQTTESPKKEIIIEFDENRSDYADMLKGILSICNNSDAADLNKKIHINRYDMIKVRDNKSQISENIYEIVIGFPNSMDWCEEVVNYHGLHICMMGKTAHLYVDETHSDKKEIKEFLKFSALVENDFNKFKSRRSVEGMTGMSATIWNPSIALASFKSQLNEDAIDRYLDVPMYFKWWFGKIASVFKTIFRALGFGRQNEVIKQKYKTLIKNFYVFYLPMFIGELDAKR